MELLARRDACIKAVQEFLPVFIKVICTTMSYIDGTGPLYLSYILEYMVLGKGTRGGLASGIVKDGHLPVNGMVRSA